MFSLLAALAFAWAEDPRGLAQARVATTYDSNILVAPDSMFDQGTPSHLGDARLGTAAELGYAVIRSASTRLAPTAVIDLTNSARAERAAGDAYRFAVAVPLRFERDGYRLDLRPGAQTLSMDPTLTTRKTTVQDSLMLDVGGAVPFGRAFGAHLDLEYRRDDSRLQDSVGPDDGDADKWTGRLGGAFARGGVLAKLDLGIVANQARGTRRRYLREELTAAVESPLAFARGRWRYWAALGAYRLSVPRAVPNRRDLNLTTSAGMRVPLADRVTLEIGLSYARNSGRSQVFNYDRFTAHTAFIVARGF